MNAWTRMRIVVLTIGCLALGRVLPIQAGTIQWDGGPVGTGTGTSWNAAVNWAGDVKPGSADTVEFNGLNTMPSAGLAEGKVISLDAPQTVYQIRLPSYDQQMPNFTIGNAADVAAGNALTLTLVTRQDHMGNTLTIGANVVLAANSIWNIDPGYNGGIAVSGVISGLGMSLTKTNTGTLWLYGTNTYSGTTTISQGTLQLGDGSTRNGSIAGDIVNNSALLINNPFALASGNISGAGSITKSGSGTLLIGSATSPMGVGAFAINGGGLGTTLSGLVLSNSSYAWNGDFSYNGPQGIDFGGTGTVVLSASRAVTVNASTLSVSRVITGSGYSLTKNGVGTLQLRGTNNYSGGTVVNDGVLALTDAGRAGTASLTVVFPGAVVLDNTASNSDHLADAAPVNLRGQLTLIGNGSGASTENAGALTNGAAPGTITVLPGSGQSALLTFASLGARSTGASGLCRGTGLGSALGANTANIKFSSAPTVTAFGSLAALDGSGTLVTPNAAILRGIVADNSATGSGIGFATYDSVGNGVRLLDPGAEQSTTYAAGNANVRLNLSGNMAITGGAGNTLQIDNVSGTAYAVTNSGSALAPHNGLLFTGTNAITLTGGTMNVNSGGNSEAIILPLNTAGVTVNTAITGTNVTIGGNGNITLGATVNAAALGAGNVRINNAATTLLASAETGALIINNGTLKLTTGGSLYAATVNTGNNGTVDLSIYKPGILDLNGISASDNGFQGSGMITNSAAGLATLTSDWEPLGGNYNSFTPNFSGSIGGNVKLVITGGGYYDRNYVQELSGSNSFTGGVQLNAAPGLFPMSPTALGIGGTLTIASGAYLFGNGQTLTTTNPQTWSGPWSFDYIYDTTHLTTLGTLGNLTFGPGAITMTANGGITVNANTLAFGGGVGESGGSCSFTKAGAGTLVFNGSNTYSGATTVNVGVLTVGSGGYLSATTAPLAVNNPNTGPTTAVTLNLSSTQTVGSLSGTITTPASNNTAVISLNGLAANLTVNQTNDATFAGTFTGAGSFCMGSSSTSNLTLNGSNSLTGVTLVNAGGLRVNGYLGSANVSVAAGGTLGGTGFLAGATTVNGTLAPGSSNATLTVRNNVTIANGGKLSITFDAAGHHGQLAVTGALDLSSVSDTLQLSVPAGLKKTGSYTLATVTNGITGVFDTVTGLPGGGVITYKATTISLFFPGGTTIFVQ